MSEFEVGNLVLCKRGWNNELRQGFVMEKSKAPGHDYYVVIVDYGSMVGYDVSLALIDLDYKSYMFDQK